MHGDDERKVKHDARLATVIQTSFDTDVLSFADACAFLEPFRWSRCNRFWCEMTEQNVPLDDGGRWFHEVVSLDCDNKAFTWGITAELSFVIHTEAHEASSEYVLAGPPAPPSPDVVVDEGSLTVHRLAGTTLRISTTKRVLFSEDFPGEGLSLLICVLGYGDIAENFVYTCAVAGVHPDPDPKKPSAKPDGGSTVDDVIDRAAVAAKASIDECATAARATLDKVQRGEYGADALATDLRGAFERMLRDGATAADLMIEGAARLRERQGPQP